MLMDLCLRLFDSRGPFIRYNVNGYVWGGQSVMTKYYVEYPVETYTQYENNKSQSLNAIINNNENISYGFVEVFGCIYCPFRLSMPQAHFNQYIS